MYKRKNKNNFIIFELTFQTFSDEFPKIFRLIVFSFVIIIISIFINIIFLQSDVRHPPSNPYITESQRIGFWTHFLTCIVIILSCNRVL